MALFRKVIVRPGTYSVRTAKGRRIVPVTRDYIKELYDTNTKILESGMNIPAPYAHRDGENIVPSILTDEDTDAETKQKKKWSSDINAGFWKKFEVGKDGELAGYVEVPGNENDPNTPAGKLGTTIKETSVFVEPEWEDGLGRKWNKALRHIALVTNPIEPGQSNFEPVTSDYALAMSFSMADEIGGSPSSPGKDTEKKEPSSEDQSSETSQEGVGDEGKTESEDTKELDATGEARIGEIVSLFKEKFGVEMPSDTTCDNFFDRLRTILISTPSEDEEDLMGLRKQKPNKMGKDNKDDKGKDKDGKPFGSETQNTSSNSYSMNDNPEVIQDVDKKSSKLLEKYLAALKKSLAERIQAAVAAGKIGKKYAAETLQPQLDALVMSFEDMDEEGEFKKTELEIRLEMAEELPSLNDLVSGKMPAGGIYAAEPSDAPAVTSAEDIEKSYSLFM